MVLKATPQTHTPFLRVTPFSKLAVPGQTENRVELGLEKKRGKNKTKECVVWRVT